MIPLTTLFDDYIDRPILTEQKNPFESIVPPPIKVGRNNEVVLVYLILERYVQIWRELSLIMIVFSITIAQDNEVVLSSLAFRR